MLTGEHPVYFELGVAVVNPDAGLFALSVWPRMCWPFSCANIKQEYFFVSRQTEPEP